MQLRRTKSTPEIARTLGIGSSTLRRLAAQGALPGLKVGGQWRFDEQEVYAALTKSYAASPFFTQLALRVEDSPARRAAAREQLIAHGLINP